MKKRILVVDNDLSILAALSKALQTAGYQVTTINNPTDALNAFGPDGYDLVIIGWEMPEMNGGQLAQIIKELRPKVPIILYTAEYKDDAQVPAVNAVVQKEGSVGPLLDVVAIYLK
jgi:DNA-binding NtrC family response regulator